MRWLTYKPLGEELCRLCRGMVDSSGRLDDDGYRSKVFSRMVPEAVRRDHVMVWTLVDEFGLEREGNHVVFIESPALVDMFCKVRIRLEGSPLRLPFKYFTVAVPEGSMVGEYKARPLLVSRCRDKERESLFRKFGVKYLGEPLNRVSDSLNECVSMVIRNEHGCLRHSIPDDRLMDVLEKEDINSVVGRYPIAANCDSDESRMQAMMTRMVCGMAAYLEARPEALAEGPPGAFVARDMGGRGYFRGGIVKNTAKAPPGLGRDRGSMETHYRSWYYRRYPARQDGTRRPGLVFVTDTIVKENAEMSTVLS